MNVPKWSSFRGCEDGWFSVADCSDVGDYSIWLKGFSPPRYGWLKSEARSVLIGWLLLLVAGGGGLFCLSSGRLVPLLILLVPLAFVGAAVASENVPDGPIEKSVRDYRCLFGHALSDNGWDEERLESEFREMLLHANPRYVRGGKETIRRYLERGRILNHRGAAPPNAAPLGVEKEETTLSPVRQTGDALNEKPQLICFAL